MLDYDSWLESPYWEQDEGGDTVCRKDINMSFNITFSIEEEYVTFNGNIEQNVEYITGYGDVEDSYNETNKEINGNLGNDLFSDEFLNDLKDRIAKLGIVEFKDLLSKDPKIIGLCFLRGSTHNKNLNYDWSEDCGWINESGYSDIDEIEKNNDIKEIFSLIVFEYDLIDLNFEEMTDEELYNIIKIGIENKCVKIETCDSYTKETEIDPRDYYGYPD